MENIFVEYDDILANCGMRVSYDSRLFKSQIEYYKNWRNIILKRHHPFIEAYIESEYNVKNIKDKMGYTIKDLESIFLRIQSQFEMYEDDNRIVFKDMCLDIYNRGVFSNNIFKKEDNIQEEDIFEDILEEPEIEEVIEEIIEEEDEKIADIVNEDDFKEIVKPIEPKETIDDILAKSQIIDSIILNFKNKEVVNEFDIYKTMISSIESVINNDISRNDKVYKIVEILSEVKDFSKYDEIFPASLVRSIKLISDGLKIEEASKTLKKNKYYMIQTILGTNTPRCNSEKGVLLFLKEYVEKNS